MSYDCPAIMPDSEDKIPRRQVLRVLGGAALGGSAVGLASLLGCASERPQGPQVVRMALADLPEGEHVRVLVGAGAADVIRTAQVVVALSLQCTHFGCEVRWFGEQQRYMCPCHDGIYAADGRVLAGPPPRSLDRIPVRIEGDVVVIGTEITPTAQEPA